VSSSFGSVPGPVGTVCHISTCVGRPCTGKSHQRSARRCKSSGGHTSICVGRPCTARSHQRSARRRKSSGGHTSLSLLVLGGMATGWLLVGGGQRNGGRVVGRRWAGCSGLTARRRCPGGGKAVAWWRAGDCLAPG